MLLSAADRSGNMPQQRSDKHHCCSSARPSQQLAAQAEDDDDEEEEEEEEEGPRAPSCVGRNEHLLQHNKHTHAPPQAAAAAAAAAAAGRAMEGGAAAMDGLRCWQGDGLRCWQGGEAAKSLSQEERRALAQAACDEANKPVAPHELAAFERE